MQDKCLYEWRGRQQDPAKVRKALLDSVADNHDCATSPCSDVVIRFETPIMRSCDFVQRGVSISSPRAPTTLQTRTSQQRRDASGR